MNKSENSIPDGRGILLLFGLGFDESYQMIGKLLLLYRT